MKHFSKINQNEGDNIIILFNKDIKIKEIATQLNRCVATIRLFLKRRNIWKPQRFTIENTPSPIYLREELSNIDIFDSEVWCRIIGFENSHLISSHGRIYSLPRTILRKDARFFKCEGKIMKGRLSNGYKAVTIDGNCFFIYRLVAKHFIPNPTNLPLIHHIDGGRTNDRIDNLIWSDYKTNSIEGFKRQNRYLKSGIRKRDKLYPSLDDINNNNLQFLEEEWKDIIGFEGLYKISNYGRILSLARIDASGHSRNERILTTNKFRVQSLCNNSKVFTLLVSRLVAQHFIINPNNLPCVNHLDGNPLNNKITNLEWCSYYNNNIHALETGLRNPVKGIRIVSTKLSECDVRDIRKLYSDTNLTMKQLSERYNICPQQVRKVLTREAWSHIN